VLGDRPKIAIVHDYLTQRGGAERVVLVLARAFPGASIYTSFYDPHGTFPEFRELDVRTVRLNRLSLLRRRHRLALPLLPSAFSRVEIDADAIVCSSSGWAHGARTRGRKIVYCHAPARWLYQADRYTPRRLAVGSLVLAVLRPPLLRWDRRAAASADRYLVNSTAIRDQVRSIYAVDAEVLAPPPCLDVMGRRLPTEVAPGFFLCVSRLLPYKNVDAVVEAFAELPDERLVVVGDGPEWGRLQRNLPQNVQLLGSVGDDALRTLYADSVALVAAAHEDFGLTPLEAASFGRPTAALRAGGYLDTVVEGRNGVFFDGPEAAKIAAAVRTVSTYAWSVERIQLHAHEFSEERFVRRLRAVVNEELAERSASIRG
jgi:glycosyltransferase involved in cell wall biosynthesis